MDLAELTREMNRFVEAMGWYEHNSPKPQTPVNLAKSLVMEASEVLECFQWRESPIDKRALEGELADVLLYTLQLASVLDINLEAATLAKLKANYGRDW